MEWCLELGVSNVTVFAFGEDNFKRSDEEVTELMTLAEEKLWQLLEVGPPDPPAVRCSKLLDLRLFC